MPGPFYMAYAGGAIVDQTTLVTNGTTHGASFETITLVGDTAAGGPQLTNIASIEGLEQAALYAISASGLDALAIYDNTVLSGLPNSLNLTDPASGTTQSEQFFATKAVTVGTVLATFSAGNSGVTILDAGTLPAGLYGIYGTAIGETDVPIGTTEGTTTTTGGGIMTVSTAFFDYDGAGGGAMSVLAATPNTVTGDDEFGSEVRTTSYLVDFQEVRATDSGDFPAVLLGFPTGDPAIVTGIPSSALAGLEPGLVYNITGNGIPVGSTFVAPSGGTEITLDLAATASDTNAILTITGPRTPNAGTFDPAAYNRFDEQIVSLEIAQEEGGFATLTVDIRNPGVGLLATGRYLWCWLSWDQAWNPAGNVPDLVPLFNGRLVGVPRLQAGEIVQLQFLARPDDLNAQKTALAESLQVLPYYDPVWLTSNTTLDTVLETYSALWHIDRTSLAVSTSDVLEGEDGVIDVGEEESLYDHFSLSYGQPPLVATTVTGTVTWSQQAEGTLDITQQLVKGFYDAGSAYRYKFGTKAWGRGGGGLIQCLSGNGLKSDWPKAGTTIGGGWSLKNGADYDGIPWCYIIDATDQQGGWVKPVYYNVIYEGMSPPATDSTTETSNVDVFLHPFGTFSAAFPLNVYKIRMWLDYRANRKRTETVSAVVMAGVQQELSDSAESDREAISLTSEFVGQAIDLDGSVPIGNVAYRSYFQSERGAASLEYLLLAARAKMRARARSVDITFAVAWADALDITLRHSVQLTDRRLPGGSATGKVKSYKLTCSTQGVMLGEFTIGASIGTGDGTAPQAGAPSYVEAGYTDDYQTVSGAQIPLGVTDGDIAYETLDDFTISDDGVDLTNPTAASMINECSVVNGMFEQMNKLRPFQNSKWPQNGNPIKQNISTNVTLDLKPLTGTEFHTEFFPAITPLVLPKTIDLSAPLPGA